MEAQEELNLMRPSSDGSPIIDREKQKLEIIELHKKEMALFEREDKAGYTLVAELKKEKYWKKEGELGPKWIMDFSYEGVTHELMEWYMTKKG